MIDFMSDINLHKHESADVTRIACGQHLSQLLSAYADQEVFLLVSGGSALGVLGDINVAQLSSSVHVCVVDERFGVAKDDQNYYQLSQTDFARGFIAQGGMVCDTSLHDLNSLATAEARFGAHLQSIASQSRDGVRVITILGIGPDGHTAGIMPYPDDVETFHSLFYDKKRLAVGYDVGEKSPFSERVTASASFLRQHVSHTIVYATGAEKADVLESVLATGDDPHVYPGRIIHDMSDVHMYTDCVTAQ